LACRVLLIEGDSFTGPLVSRFAWEIGDSGTCEMHGLGFRIVDSRPIEVPREKAFRNFVYMPDAPKKPSGLIGAMHLTFDALRAAAPPEPLSGEPRGLNSSLYRRVLWHRYRTELSPVLAGYDLYHWHCFLPEYLPILELLPPSAPVLVSLWGSDLFRTTGVAELKRQLAVCRRASLFTVASPEMRETFLSKFGREFYDKVRIQTYGIDQMKSAAELPRDARDRFLQSLGISTARTIITVGNSGSTGNQHPAVLDQISRLDESLRARIALLMPMTYSAPPGYVDRVREAAVRCGVPCHIWDTSMSNEDVALLRAASDVMIHVPISDQFSAAMIESLSAGSVLITGVWLPYSRLRVNSIYYREVSQVSDLFATLTAVLTHLPEEKAKTAGAGKILEGLVSWDSVRPQWRGLYRELLGE
jgi:hypothetical protein